MDKPRHSLTREMAKGEESAVKSETRACVERNGASFKTVLWEKKIERLESRQADQEMLLFHILSTRFEARCRAIGGGVGGDMQGNQSATAGER